MNIPNPNFTPSENGKTTFRLYPGFSKLLSFLLRLVRALFPKLWDIVCFVASCALVFLGLFSSAGWVELAILPLVLSLFVFNPRIRFSLFSGYFVWPISIFILALPITEIGQTATVGLIVFTTVLLCLTLLRTGLGLGCLLLSVIPLFPANPLFAAGFIMPSTGLYGICVLCLVIFILERQDFLPMRVVLGIALLSFPQVAYMVIDWSKIPDGAIAQNVSHPLSNTPPSLSFDLQLLSEDSVLSNINMGHSYVMGRESGCAILPKWCKEFDGRPENFYKITNLIDGWASVEKCLSSDCQRTIFIHGETSPFTKLLPKNISSYFTIGFWESWFEYEGKVAWFTPLESFNHIEWIKRSLKQPLGAIVISDTTWLAPFSAETIQRNLSPVFGALFAIPPHVFDPDKEALSFGPSPSQN